MKIYRGFNTRNNTVKNMVMNRLGMKLHAEEQPKEANTENTQAQQPQQTVNFEDLISKARNDEKNKAYKRLEAKDKKIEELTTRNNELVIQVGEKDVEITNLKKQIEGAKKDGAKFESDEVARLQKENDKLAKKVTEMENNTVDVEALEEGIKAKYEVQLYRTNQIHAQGGALIQELVIGETKEEIDASIEVAKNRYQEIIGSVAPQQTQAPKVNVPTGNVTTEQFSLNSLNSDDISKMTPAEWAEYRKKFGFNR